MRATAITYLNPAVAVVAGAVLLGERVTGWTVAGFVLVIAGSLLVTRRARTTSRAVAARDTDAGGELVPAAPVRRASSA